MSEPVKKKPIQSDTPPSDEFIRSFVHSGGCREVCDCGREHFSEDKSWTYEEGELEDLLGRAAENPDAFVSHGEFTIERMELGGRIFVVDCPCNSARPYEIFIWDNRSDIAKYLEERVKRMAQESLEAGGDVGRVLVALKAAAELEGIQ